MRRLIPFLLAMLPVSAFAASPPLFGPLQIQNNFSEILANGSQAAARANLGAAASGANSDITSLSGLTTALSPTEGGTGVANAAGSTLTLGGAVHFSGAYGVTLTATGATNLTLPTSGTLATTSTFAAPPAIGSATAAAGTFTTLTASSIIDSELTGSTQCLEVNSSGKLIGTGGACPSGSGTVSSGTAGQLAGYSATGTTVVGTPNITYSGGTLTLGVGSVAGALVLQNTTSGSIKLITPSGALGTVTLTVPDATDTLADLSSAQTFTHKTLTAPDINGGTIDGAVIGGTTPEAATFTTLATSASAAVAAAGTTQTTATVLPASLDVVSSVTAGSATGVVLPVVPVGTQILVLNRAAAAVSVYPQSGATIESLGSNTPSGVAPGGSANFIEVAANQWDVE